MYQVKQNIFFKLILLVFLVRLLEYFKYIFGWHYVSIG